MRTYLYALAFIVLLNTVFSCSESSKQHKTQTHSSQENAYADELNPNKIKRIKQALKAESFIKLPLHSLISVFEMEDIKRTSFSKLLNRRTNQTVLDSLYKGFHLRRNRFPKPHIDEFSQVKSQSNDSTYCKFIGQISHPSENRALLILQKPEIKIGYSQDSKHVFLALINTLNFEILDHTVLTVEYPNDIYDEVFHYTFFEIDITEDLIVNINAEGNAYESFSPYEWVEMKIGDDKFEIVEELEYDHMGDVDGSHSQNYWYLERKNDVLVSFDTEEYDLEDQFYKQINYKEWNEKTKGYESVSVQDTLILKDHLGRRWVDLIEYTPNSTNCNDDVFIYGCNSAHYIQHIYENLDDRLTEGYLEVKYEHLSNGSLRLKSREHYSLKLLPYRDWRIVDLPVESHYSYYGDEYRDEKQPVRWEFSNYFLTNSELEHLLDGEIEFEESRAKIERDSLSKAQNTFELNQIKSIVSTLPKLNVKGKNVKKLKKINKQFPAYFYNYFQIDSTFQILGLTYESDITSYNRTSIMTYSTQSDKYFVNNHNRHIDLPKATPIFIEGNSIKYEKIFTRNLGKKGFEHRRLLVNRDLKGSGVSNGSKLLKRMRYSPHYSEVALKIEDGKNKVEFSTVDDFIPKQTNSVALLKNVLNNKCLDLISIDGQSGHYKRYLYHSSNSNRLKQILEVKYKIDEDKIVNLEFRMGESEVDLKKQSHIAYKLYPKGHKKHKPWKWKYFYAKTKRALKKMMKK